jgi:hypothetical protein
MKMHNPPEPPDDRFDIDHGVSGAGIEVLPTERDALIRMGLLNEVARNDKKAVRDALYAFFERHLDPETPPPPSPVPLQIMS